VDLPTYTNIWRIEKRLYKIYDFRLPIPLPIGQIAVFVAITVPYVTVLTLIGLPFDHRLFWLYILPPGLATWLATRPVIENKRLPELLSSQIRYLAEPRTWCRLMPAEEPAEIFVVARVWHRAPARQKQRKKQVGPSRAAPAPARVNAPDWAAPAALRPAASAMPAATAVTAAPAGRGADSAYTANAARAGGPGVRVRAAAHGADRSAVGARSRAAAPRTAQAAPARGAGQGALPARGATALPGGHRPDRREQQSPESPEGPKVCAPGHRTPSDPAATPSREPGPRPAGVPWERRPVQPPRQNRPVWPKAPAASREVGTAGTAPEHAEVTGRDTGSPPASPGGGSGGRPPGQPGGGSGGRPPGQPGASREQERHEEGRGQERARGGPGWPERASVEVAHSDQRDEVTEITRHAAGDAGRAGQAGSRPGQDPDESRDAYLRAASGRPAVLPPVPPPPTGPAAPVEPATQPQESQQAHKRPLAPEAGEAPASSGAAPRGAAPPPVAQAPSPPRQQSPPQPPSAPPAAPPGPHGPPGSPAAQAPAASAAGTPAPPALASPPETSPGPPMAGRADGPAAGRPDGPEPPAPLARGDAPPEPPEPPRSVERVVHRRREDRGPGWHRRAKVVVGGLGPGRADPEEHDKERCRIPLPGPRRILVLGCTSGAGQTATALMLGQLLASLRGQPVAALDLNPGEGSLTRRLRVRPAATVGELLIDTATGGLAARGLLARAGRGLEVISSGEDRLAVQSLDDHDYVQLAGVLAQRYGLTVVDPAASTVARVLRIADQLVLVAPASADAPRAVAMTHEWLDGHGHTELAARAVTVINGVSKRSMADVLQAENVARGRCRAIVRVPWDDQLDSDRGPAPEALRQQTRHAFTALAGVSVAGLALAADAAEVSR
jgi:MinD-like ATPase involved in chromosome partitioning or flagellar assembly